MAFSLLRRPNFCYRIGLHVRPYSDRVVPANHFQVWDTKSPVKLRMEESAPGNYPPILVQTMMRQTVERFPEKVALVSYDGQIRWTYQEYYQKVTEAAKGFVSLGLRPMHGVGIMASNQPLWFVSSLAAVFAGGLSCGIYTTNSPATVKYICHHAPVDVLILQNELLLQNIMTQEPHLSEVVKAFVLLETTSKIEDERVFSWQDLLKEGQKTSDEALGKIEAEQSVNQACLLIYTSGTTGPPKAAMLSHDNVTWTSRIAMEHYQWDQEVLLSYLPLSHVAACLIDCYMSMYAGNEIHFADEKALKGTLVENLKRVRPTRFLGVPRVWEKIAEKMQAVGQSSKGLKRLIANWAKKAATEHHESVRQGRRKEGSLSYILARKLVFNRIHNALGLDRAVALPAGTSSSAAPLHLDTFLYFQSLDIILVELLGCTETSGPQTTNLAGLRCQPGSVGQCYYGVRNKILNADGEGIGEIATRSRNVFMGYHRDKNKTLEAFEDDWFKSGDLGKFDDKGFLWMRGRKKELIITSGGENIAPVPIEDNIKGQLSGLVSQVVVIGDGQKHLSCLITLKCQQNDDQSHMSEYLDDEAKGWCQSHFANDGKVLTVSDFLNSKSLLSEVQKAIDKANEKATANPHKVQKFTILPVDFSIQGGELGPTLKLKRHFIEKKYSEAIRRMYSDADV